MEVTINTNNETRCPDCGGKLFTEYGGWYECDDCSFAFDIKGYNKLIRSK